MTTKPEKRSRKAFQAPRTTTFLFKPEDVVVIGHDTQDGPGHPLYVSDCNAPIDPEFQRNVDRNGVDAAIDIVKYEGKACVVEGRTRVRAARVSNKLRAKDGRPQLRIKCNVVAGTEVRLVARKIRANNLRKIVGVLQKAEDLQALLDQGVPLDEAANELGVTAGTAKEWQAVLGATADVRKAVGAGKIGATAAAKIAKLEGADAQKKALAEVLASGKGSTVEAKRAVKKAQAKAAGQVPAGDGQGVTSRKEQRRMLEDAIGRLAALTEDDEYRGGYFRGFRDALRVILGEDLTGSHDEAIEIRDGIKPVLEAA